MTSTSAYIIEQEQEEPHNDLIFASFNTLAIAQAPPLPCISSPLPQLLFNSSEHQFVTTCCPLLYTNTGVMWVSFYITQVYVGIVESTLSPPLAHETG